VARASVDIGSNSLVFLVLDDEDRVLHDESRVVSLGSGLEQHGAFQPDRMSAAMEGFSDFTLTGRTFNIAPESIQAIATSASRRASNSADFFARVQEQSGIEVRVISGLEEARLTWKGALFELNPPKDTFAVVDLGGGSTEIVVGHPETDSVLDQRSIPIGTVRLNELFFSAQPALYEPDQFQRMRAHIEEAVSAIRWEGKPSALIAVAGTATTLCAMELGLKTWDRNTIHGATLSREALERWMSTLLASTPAERRSWAAVSPKRADNLLAGAAVLHAVCTASGLDHLTISDGGIRHGVLLG
jgi:exopolyphosphatase/guanosine-5'-triphosphate,3'-diphosphate pyrophosphatase